MGGCGLSAGAVGGWVWVGGNGVAGAGMCRTVVSEMCGAATPTDISLRIRSTCLHEGYGGIGCIAMDSNRQAEAAEEFLAFDVPDEALERAVRLRTASFHLVISHSPMVSLPVATVGLRPESTWLSHWRPWRWAGSIRRGAIGEDHSTISFGSVAMLQ
jgi:hypothetical protein